VLQESSDGGAGLHSMPAELMVWVVQLVASDFIAGLSPSSSFSDEKQKHACVLN